MKLNANRFKGDGEKWVEIFSEFYVGSNVLLSIIQFALFFLF